MFHVQQGAGPFSVVQNNADLGKTVSFGGLMFKPEGTMPAKPDHRPVFRPGTPCEKQQVADLNAPRGAAEALAHPDPQPTAADKLREQAAQTDLQRALEILKGQKKGDIAAKYNENLNNLALDKANQLLQVPMQAAAVQQYGDKAQVAAKYKKEFGK
jgi:hypothetical protein